MATGKRRGLQDLPVKVDLNLVYDPEEVERSVWLFGCYLARRGLLPLPEVPLQHPALINTGQDKEGEP